ncbi:MAG: phage integrase SAM-like domain-containing protein [Pseudomonadota bacterium]
MTIQSRPRGRPSRYAEYDAMEANLLSGASKRPKYLNGIGVFKGKSSSTVWAKITLPHGATLKGRIHAPGSSVEIKLGKRSSWDWAQLEAERDRLQGLADRGEPLEEKPAVTFAEYAEDWLERKKSTVKDHIVAKGHVRKKLCPTFGGKALDQITPADVNRWIGERSAEVKPTTVKRYMSTLNAILNDALKSGLIVDNPASKADKIRGIESRERFVTPEEWKQILKTIDEIQAQQEANKERYPRQIRGWLKPYVVWAYHSGMRRSEILALTWQNVRQMKDDLVTIEVCILRMGSRVT